MINQNEISPKVKESVDKILKMYEHIIKSYLALPENDKILISEADIKEFEGFDLNDLEENEYRIYTLLLMNEHKLYPYVFNYINDFAYLNVDHYDCNSHHSVMPRYQKRYSKYEQIAIDPKQNLTAAQLIELCPQ